MVFGYFVHYSLEKLGNVCFSLKGDADKAKELQIEINTN